MRSVADEAGLTKSTVHYYLRDANELIDLAVLGFLDVLADHAAGLIAAAPDGLEALCALVRIFTARDVPPIALADATLWSDFATHASRRGALDELALCLDTFSALFEQRADAHRRRQRGMARALHSPLPARHAQSEARCRGSHRRDRVRRLGARRRHPRSAAMLTTSTPCDDVDPEVRHRITRGVFEELFPHTVHEEEVLVTVARGRTKSGDR